MTTAIRTAPTSLIHCVTSDDQPYTVSVMFDPSFGRMRPGSARSQ